LEQVSVDKPGDTSLKRGHCPDLMSRCRLKLLLDRVKRRTNLCHAGWWKAVNTNLVN
jgi:hypothetical protein